MSQGQRQNAQEGPDNIHLWNENDHHPEQGNNAKGVEQRDLENEPVRHFHLAANFAWVPVQKPKEKKSGGARWVDPNVKAAQRDLERVLGMRVRIRDRNNKGRIVIEYSTLEDFDRVVGALRGKGRV